MADSTLAESLQAWGVVIFITIVLSLGAGALAYVILKPIVGWAFEPLADDTET